MPRTTNFEFGDVLLVPFPFTDQSASKQRPAVVVSSQTLHRESADVIVVSVTTQVRSASSLEMPIAHWREAGLLQPSLIKPKLATIDTRLVVKHLGRLHDEDRATLKTALAAVLG